MLLGTLTAGLFWNILAVKHEIHGRGVVRDGKGVIGAGKKQLGNIRVFHGRSTY